MWRQLISTVNHNEKKHEKEEQQIEKHKIAHPVPSVATSKPMQPAPQLPILSNYTFFNPLASKSASQPATTNAEQQQAGISSSTSTGFQFFQPRRHSTAFETLHNKNMQSSGSNATQSRRNSVEMMDTDETSNK